MTNKEEELRIKVVERLADYKFNSTQIYTTEQQADIIIDLIKAQAKTQQAEFIKKLKDGIDFIAQDPYDGFDLQIAEVIKLEIDKTAKEVFG